MKILKIALVTLVICGVSAGFLGCASESESSATNRIVDIQRGNLTIDISASGNLALSVLENLAFELAGTVDEALVEEGESVEEGQLLASLDTSQWEAEQLTLQRQLTQAERQVTTKKRDLLQAEINLKNAEQDLEQAQNGTTTTITGDIRTTTTDPLEIEMKELQLELAQGRLEDAQLAVDDAERSVEDAQKALSDAQNASPEVKAPFAGFITKVNVKGGDEVKKGTVAVVIADPNKFEVDVLVSEMDINQVQVGGYAMVQPTAFTTVSLPAVVSHISPTATIQQGVVNYKVTVEVQSLETVMQQRQQSFQEGRQNPPQGELSERLKQSVEEGRITQEQLDEMLKQRQQGQGWTLPQTAPAALENLQLRDGLTVTVSIIVSQRTNVLLVPNGAITTRGGRSYVQVVLADGTTEERLITTGLNDWQYTEVTGGLEEGEKVIVPQGATTTTTTQSQQRERQMIPIGPGIGGVFR